MYAEPSGGIRVGIFFQQCGWRTPFIFQSCLEAHTTFFVRSRSAVGMTRDQFVLCINALGWIGFKLLCKGKEKQVPREGKKDKKEKKVEKTFTKNILIYLVDN